MARFFARRLAGFAAVLLALSFIIFSLLDLVPGDPVKILVGTRRLTPEVRAAITSQYGLDEPLLLRYWHWLLRALRGDFGSSVRSATPVTDVLAARDARRARHLGCNNHAARAPRFPPGSRGSRRTDDGYPRG